MTSETARIPAAGGGRREQILREAARLFAAKGFHGVGVDEIGAAVGISGPGLYRHFPGKDAMLAEMLVGISERLLAGGQACARAGAEPAAVLDALIRGHIDFALRDRPLIVLHDRDLDSLPEQERRRVRRLQRQYVEIWVDTLRRAQPALAEDEPRARSAVHAVFGLLNSTPHSATADSATGRHGAATLDREQLAGLLFRLARGAFAAA